MNSRHCLDILMIGLRIETLYAVHHSFIRQRFIEQPPLRIFRDRFVYFHINFSTIVVGLAFYMQLFFFISSIHSISTIWLSNRIRVSDQLSKDLCSLVFFFSFSIFRCDFQFVQFSSLLHFIFVVTHEGVGMVGLSGNRLRNCLINGIIESFDCVLSALDHTHYTTLLLRATF